jgi:hypothetical protein
MASTLTRRKPEGDFFNIAFHSPETFDWSNGRLQFLLLNILTVRPSRLFAEKEEHRQNETAGL